MIAALQKSSEHGADHYTQQLAKRSQEQWTMDHKGGLT